MTEERHSSGWQALLALRLELEEDCRGPVDDGKLKVDLDRFATLYKRADYREQGEYHWQLALRFGRVAELP